jgi:hypothetical protein
MRVCDKGQRVALVRARYIFYTHARIVILRQGSPGQTPRECRGRRLFSRRPNYHNILVCIIVTHRVSVPRKNHDTLTYTLPFMINQK